MEEWRKLGDQTAENIMVNGLELDFLEEIDLLTEPPEYLITKGVQEKFLWEFIPGWLEEGVIGELVPPIPPSFFSRMFTVPKDGGEKRRPIIDLSLLNKRIRKKGFRMEDLKKVARIVGPNLWGVKLDLKDAYFHVPISPEFWKYFVFVLGERVFFFKVLPFGLTSAPWAFSRVLKPIKKLLRLQGIQVTAFLDDFLILARSFQECLDHTAKVIDLLQRLGFRINWEKSSKAPQKRLEYLGVILDLETLTFSLPEDKVQTILLYCRNGQKASLLSRRVLERLVGFFNFAAQYLRLGKLYLKPIQAWMNLHTSVSQRDGLVQIDASLREALIPALPSANEASSIFKSFDDRCLRLRLGGNSSSRDPSWGLASGMEQSVDKLERIEGYSFIADGLSVKTGGALRKDPFRQQVSLGLYQERRLPCLQSSLGALEGSAALCPVKGDNSLSGSPKGLSERSGRQSFQEHFDKYRVESGQALLREPLQEVGSPSNRSVCYSREQPAPSLRFSLPRSQGSCLRRLQFGLGPLELNFPLSSLPGFGRGNSEAGGLQGRGFFNSSFLANGSLVRLLRQEVSGQDSPPRRGLLVPDMFRNNVLPQAPFYFQPSRLGSIEQAIRKEGLNDFSVRVLLRCHKKSTIRQYQSVWSKFLAFLSREGILHHKVNVKDVLNFLSFFAEFHNFAYKTLAVYKCALRLPLLFCLGLNLDCELVTYFMRGLFDLNPPPTHGFMPSWDLSDLLYLRSDEFFPLESISWYRLTQKTLALLLLASGRRISEIAALSRDFYKRGSRIFLKWVRGFRAKNHTVDHSPEDPSILEMSRVDDLDLRNCPVRAWKVFLDRRSLVTNVRDDACLWTLEVKALFTAFKALIRDSRRFVGKPDNIVMVPQQTKKLATSYCIKYFANANKALHKRTGNKVFGTLIRHYIRDVPRLRIPVSLPLGTVPPGVR